MKGRQKGTGTAWWREKEQHWEGEITVGQDEFGKRIKKRAVGKTQEEVFEKLAKLKEEHLRNPTEAGVNLSPGLTLQGFVEAYWYPTVRQKISAKTYDRYVLDYGYVADYLGWLPLGQVTSAAILQAYSRMELDGQTDYQRHKGAKALRRILKLAVHLDVLARSPAEGMPLPRFQKDDVHPLQPEQLKALLEANREDRLYALYVVAADTGARQGELFALEWSDWFPDSRELSITKAVEDHKGVLRLKETKTKASRRRIVVSQRTVEALAEHRERMTAEAEYHQSRLIFPNVDGNWLRCSNFHRDYWQPALARAELPAFRFHDLRHTCATLLLREGDNINSIADRLGHSSPEMIWKTYGHVLPRMRRESARRIEQFL